ncbi:MULTISPECIES: hypothetical protein [unclassified Endozoicomonas]|uniref:hypothetical protein n=1 Tax=unclassified Endozoicomonas TaxID=2644528 RepID=UPI003BB59D05
MKWSGGSSTGRVWCRADRGTETGPGAHEVSEPERFPDGRRQYRAGRAAQRQHSLRTDLLNLGRSAQGQGLQGINSAAALESQRNQPTVQQSARNQGGFFGTIWTLAGIGAAALF